MRAGSHSWLSPPAAASVKAEGGSGYLAARLPARFQVPIINKGYISACRDDLPKRTATVSLRMMLGNGVDRSSAQKVRRTKVETRWQKS
jgi:hypothetical protein